MSKKHYRAGAIGYTGEGNYGHGLHLAYHRLENVEFIIGNTDSNTPIRKLSAILQLSKPEDYKGSELQLFNGDKEPEKLPINQGSIVIFTS